MCLLSSLTTMTHNFDKRMKSLVFKVFYISYFDSFTRLPYSLCNKLSSPFVCRVPARIRTFITAFEFIRTRVHIKLTEPLRGPCTGFCIPFRAIFGVLLFLPVNMNLAIIVITNHS